MRGATKATVYKMTDGTISIHAPHAGSDFRVNTSSLNRLYFNPRSPCGERLSFVYNASDDNIFQSTLPMRGATIWK